LLSTPAKPEEEQDTEEKDQLVADHVALYALVRAGYAPERFASFLNESMMNKGKTGNWISDFFGLTGEANLRYPVNARQNNRSPTTLFRPGCAAPWKSA